MELDHVEAFLAIARSGGFGRGSAALHLSQPAASRRIKLLDSLTAQDVPGNELRRQRRSARYARPN